MRWYQDQPPLMGQDPFVFRFDDNIYLIESQDEKRITISPLNPLDISHSTLSKSQGWVVHDEPDEFQLWSPEAHIVNGKWVILYSFSDGENHTHRTHVLECGAVTNSPPHAPLFVLERHKFGLDIWGIDCTVFSHNDILYLVWSGWESNRQEFPQHLYIAPWSDPERRVKIAEPYFGWEGRILEGPQWSPTHGGLFYSANASWTTDYSIGFLRLVGDNPLESSHWAKCRTPIFQNVGHAQPFESHLIYHTKLSPFPGWTDRALAIRPLSDVELN